MDERAVAEPVRREAERAVGRKRREQPLEPPLALFEGKAREVLAVEVQQVEDEVDELPGALAGEQPLQRLEARAPVGHQDGDLAVEQRLVDRQALRLGDNGREALGPVVAMPAQEPDLAAVDAAADAVAVELDLVQPALAGRCALHERGELRQKLIGQGRARSLFAGGCRDLHRGAALAGAASQVRTPRAAPHCPGGRRAKTRSRADERAGAARPWSPAREEAAPGGAASCQGHFASSRLGRRPHSVSAQPRRLSPRASSANSAAGRGAPNAAEQPPAASPPSALRTVLAVASFLSG